MKINNKFLLGIGLGSLLITPSSDSEPKLKDRIFQNEMIDERSSAEVYYDALNFLMITEFYNSESDLIIEELRRTLEPEKATKYEKILPIFYTG